MLRSTEKTPARRPPALRSAREGYVLLLVALIVGPLLALLVIPYRMTAQIRLLRSEIVDVVTPMMDHVGDLERLFANEVATVRGYVISGDSGLLEQLRSTRDPMGEELAQLRLLAEGNYPQVRWSIDTFVSAYEQWDEPKQQLAAGRIDRATYASGIVAEQARYETALQAMADLDHLLTAELADRIDAIHVLEQLRARLTILLVLLALLGAGSAVWIGLRLRQTSRELYDLNRTLEDRVQTSTEQVRTLASALTLAEQTERRRVAQVLHDDLQQLLYGLQVRLRMAQLRGEANDRAGQDQVLAEAFSLAGTALGTARHLTVDLSPPVLEGEGLREALAWLATQMRTRFGLDVTVLDRTDLPIPEDDVRVLLFQIVRELLLNVVQHGNTSRATVAIAERDDNLVVEVTDDGTGFDPEVALDGRSNGLGLRRAQERLHLFGGHVLVDSTPGRGTRVTLLFPVARLAPP